jgi:hypothetical protein
MAATPTGPLPEVLLCGRTATGHNVPVKVDADGLLAGGGNPFNQDLDTSDSPTFVTVTANLAGNVAGATVAATTSVATPTVKITGVVFASLPGTPVAGEVAYVTDSDTVVWGATIAGGSTNKVLAFYNGTNWTVAGK